jgi:poly(3-hydroxybutyrate) depolymerase
MAQRVAAQASSEIAAVGCHSLYLLSDAASDYVPVPIIEIHGTADKVVGYEKFAWVENGPGALSNFAAWVKLNGCTGNMSVVDHGNYETRTYDTCKGANNQRNASAKNGTEVTLVTVKGGDHNPWSGNELDGGGTAPDTTKMAWNFVKRFRRATATRTSGGGKCENPTSGTESDLPDADSKTKVSGAQRPSPSSGGKCGMVIAFAALILQISTLF